MNTKLRRHARIKPGDVYVTYSPKTSRMQTTFNASWGTSQEEDSDPNTVIIDFPDGTLCTVITTVKHMKRTHNGRLEEWCMFLVDGRICYRFVFIVGESIGLYKTTVTE